MLHVGACFTPPLNRKTIQSLNGVLQICNFAILVADSLIARSQHVALVLDLLILSTILLCEIIKSTCEILDAIGGLLRLTVLGGTSVVVCSRESRAKRSIGHDHECGGDVRVW